MKLALTFGDPSGIGPEVATKALLEVSNHDAEFHIFGAKSSIPREDQNFLENMAQEGRVVIHDENYSLFQVGQGSRASGEKALNDLKGAIRFCLEQPSAALVTGPVDKSICSLAEPHFSGQTEVLKQQVNAESVTMFLSGPSLQVGLVTTHISLGEVPEKLSLAEIQRTARHVHQHLMKTKNRPHLAVAALNPHASDRGLLGTEEAEIIEPAVDKLQEEGLWIEGPYPSDTLFCQRENFDAIICMYHDQGLIPLKLLDFRDAIQMTLGLPFLRTSVDHGTAFSLVGKNEASPKSYQRAIEYALDWLKKA